MNKLEAEIDSSQMKAANQEHDDSESSDDGDQINSSAKV